jgi:hypothetical protein
MSYKKTLHYILFIFLKKKMSKLKIPEIYLNPTIKSVTVAKTKTAPCECSRFKEENLKLNNNLNSLNLERNELYSMFDNAKSYIYKINEDYKRIQLENNSMRLYIENINKKLNKYEEEKSEFIESCELKIGNISKKLDDVRNLNEKIKKYVPEKDLIRLALAV